MSLDVEDELPLVERRARDLHFEAGFLRQRVVAAAPARGGVRGVHREERARGTAGRREKGPPRDTKPSGVTIGGVERERPRAMMHRLQRNRRELTVAGRVELDRKPSAVGIVAVGHGTS